MPTYQYECASCSHEFEILQSISENRLRKCPQCGQFSLNRLIGGGSGIIFKGSGFYETDYKRKMPVSTHVSPGPAKSRRFSRDEDGAAKTDSSKDSGVKPSSSPSPKGSHGCSPHCGCAA